MIADHFTDKITAGEKFTDEDIAAIPEAHDEVAAWLATYDGDFEFVISVKEKFEAYGALTTGQLRGMANCMLADARYKAKKAAGKTAMVGGGFYKKAAPPAAAPGLAGLDPAMIPDAGFYALPDDEDRLHFYKVDRPTEGRWAGYVFAGEVKGGNDKPRAIKGEERKILFGQIFSFGAYESMQLYGKEIGQCGICNRTLTDQDSRDFGIGPKCRAVHAKTHEHV